MEPFLQDPDGIRMVLTLLSISRAMPCKGTVSLSSITDPYKGELPLEQFQEKFENLIIETVKVMKIQPELPVYEGPHLSTKSGPNYQAMVGSIMDRSIIPDKLEQAIRTVAPGIEIYMDNILKVDRRAYMLMNKLKEKINLLRKFSIVHDPEGKERVIAIADYWSQSALKPLHDKIFKILRSVHGDMTFSQLSPSRTLPSTGPYYSLDLSAATDRFPIDFQVMVVKAITGSKEYAEA